MSGLDWACLIIAGIGLPVTYIVAKLRGIIQ